jgi:hypothetical protein
VIHDLAQQLDLPVPGRGRVVHLRQDVGLWPHPFVPPGIRNDAEGAEVVAALDDRDVGLHRVHPPGNAQGERDILVRIDVHLAPPRRGNLLDQDGQPPEGLCPEDEVHGRAALEERRAFLLFDASGDRNERTSFRSRILLV